MKITSFKTWAGEMFVILLLAIMLVSCNNSGAQTDLRSLRTVEVTGIAEMEVAPDEIILSLGIEEYFDKTKVPIEKIEKKLMQTFDRLKINREQITLQNVGNYWRYYGEELLISKRFDIKITDFSILDSLLKLTDKKGMSYLYISELKSQKIADYRKQVKVMALKAAQEKASYLLEGIDKKVGDVVSITEIIDQNGSYYYYYPYSQNYQSQAANVQMPSGSDGSNNIRKINLKYQIKAQFEIKN